MSILAMRGAANTETTIDTSIQNGEILSKATTKFGSNISGSVSLPSNMQTIIIKADNENTTPIVTLNAKSSSTSYNVQIAYNITALD